MNESCQDEPSHGKRFFGFDLHQKYATICVASQQGEVVLRIEHLSLDQLSTCAAHTLTSDDAVALGATSNTWWAYDCLAAHEGRVVVVNPTKRRLIAEARINTDELSAEALARLLQSNFVKALWIISNPIWSMLQPGGASLMPGMAEPSALLPSQYPHTRR